MADLSILAALAVPVIIIVSFLIGLGVLFKAFYIKVEQGTALIINDMSSQPKVSFTGALVYPIIYKKELMKISLITLEIDRRGKDGLICADNLRADITVAFYLRVNETVEDVLKVAKAIGANRASDKASVHELFNAKFSEALKTVGKQLDFMALFENRRNFRDRIIEVIGNDLNGYVLEDAAIDYLEQTPKSALDSDNIMDSEGIKKITQLTAQQNIHTNMLERDEELAIKKKNVETKEAMLALERQQADAEARQEREIRTIAAREAAEAKKVEEEERQKIELATIQVERTVAVEKENQQREVEVAQQNRERAIVIEKERVIRARELEQVSREREVKLQQIEAEKSIEIERKEIANVIRERIAVDKTVAMEEERIKEVREVSEADRLKQTQILAAQAKAEEEKVRHVFEAQAQEVAAKHRATEMTTLAQAELEAAAKQADAKKKLAEGVQAEVAAQGLAEANVIRAKGEADAAAILQIGKSEAEAALASGSAGAQVTREQGLARAQITRAQFEAEAQGLAEKFESMNTMSDKARQHEEYRMGLETALKEALTAIEAGKDIAKENAHILAIALRRAKIDIVGGEAHFFDNFAKSLSIGKAVDGLAGKSQMLSSVLNQFLDIKLPNDRPEPETLRSE